ncbi:hypothetical protein B0H65DRAFT_547340 [Neurospora tetraspora]|uniref:Uncharacterized protein n=1 Tax=Neurospora tetraspora TaxID=94610 RepID=A0AAE0JH32_9PEZI|nr:hypothetical protein B0H65DRAFT_547340 [Neurospora tetraspora]
MDSTKEVVQKLAKLNIDPPMRAPIQDVNASHPPSSNRTPYGLYGQSFGQTQNTEVDLNDKSTKPETTPIAAPFTASTGPQSPDNIPLRKPLKTISRNLAESLARSGNTNNPSHRTTSITKCRDRMRMGVDKFLRRDASKGLKRWLKEKERRHDRRATRAHRGGAISEGLRKRLGLKREGASLGVINEEEEEGEEDVKMEEGMEMEEDTVMTD